MTNEIVKKSSRRSRRYYLKRGRLPSFFFFFRKFYKIKFYKYLLWLYKARKHFEFYLFFYISKIFIQLNLNKILILPIYTWYKYKYYNISNFYSKYLVENNFYFISFLKKYFNRWNKMNNKNIYWSGGLTSLLFFNEDIYKNNLIEEKLTNLDENYLNFLEVKNINYLNFFFETENDLNLIKNIDFNFLELKEKYFLLEYYKLITLTVLNRILNIKFFLLSEAQNHLVLDIKEL